MLLGVLDIGSNSAQLQVFEARSGAPPLPTHAVKAPTLLGEAFGPDGAIEPAGVDRVVEAVNHAMNAARRLGVEQFYVFTTSAVRDAANRDLILDRVEAEAPVPQRRGRGPAHIPGRPPVVRLVGGPAADPRHRRRLDGDRPRPGRRA